jgi:CBS domain-containing protein
VNKTLVEQVMTTPVITAAEAMPFRDLVALLHASDIGAVPVIATAGQVLGVVSRADLTAKTAGPPATGPLRPGSRRERRRALARTARELMTAPAFTIAPEATIGQAARAMRRHRIGRLPVTFRLTGRLAGIVTRADLLRIYLRPGEEIRAEIEAAVFPLVRGVHPENLAVAVRYGIVSVWGRVENKSAISGLIRAIEEVEGVVGVDGNIAYDIDDLYPIVPASF